MTEYRVLPDAESVADAAAEQLAGRIHSVVAHKGICLVVLPGGTTPARCLERLAAMDLPWDCIHWYPGDERCYPAGHIERNDTMIRARLFSVPGHAELNFHPIPAENGPERGAAEFAAMLDEAGRLDIVMLGMGEDGHTASLFPGNPAVDDTRSAVPVYDAPKPPAERISIGWTRLAGAGDRMVIATGRSKREAVHLLAQGESLIFNRIQPTLVILDEESAGPVRR